MRSIIENKIAALELHITNLRQDPRLHSEVLSGYVYRRIEERKVQIKVLKEVLAEADIRA